MYPRQFIKWAIFRMVNECSNVEVLFYENVYLSTEAFPQNQPEVKPQLGMQYAEFHQLVQNVLKYFWRKLLE